MIRVALIFVALACIAPVAIKAPANIAAIAHQAETAGRW
jgi:hypothetical protein